MNARKGAWAVLCALAWLAGLLGSAQAGPDTGLKVWVVDGLHQEQITALGMQAGDKDARWLRLYRLTDPASRQPECCLVTPAAGAKNDQPKEVGSAMASLTAHGSVAQPFVGIAFSGGDALVQRTGPQTVQVLGKGSTSVIRVHHCVTQEGMRIDVEQDLKRRTYYVPLGMDVDAPKQYRCVAQQ